MSNPRNVLVTGASQGIGAATARAFAENGDTVFMAARSADKLKSCIESFGDAAKNCIAVSCDVTDPASVKALFETISGHPGTLDVVFNNAGTNIPAALSGDISFDDWRKVMSVNIDGAFLIASHAFKVMQTQEPQGGRIINNGSVSSHVPRYGSLPYTASKHAVLGLTKCLSIDGRAFGIACGQIDIGNTASDMTKRMSGGVPQADGTLAPEPTMDVSNVSRSVLHMASLPLDANILTLTVMATTMPYVGRG